MTFYINGIKWTLRRYKHDVVKISLYKNTVFCDYWTEY